MANILIADDNEGIRTLLSHMLRDDGHTVQVAAEGHEALKACRRQHFDLLFCDLFMPGMDGLETIRNLGKELPQLKIVAMSGGSCSYGVDLLQVAHMMGAAAILDKPFIQEEVNRALATALPRVESDTLTSRPSYAPRPALA